MEKELVNEIIDGVKQKSERHQNELYKLYGDLVYNIIKYYYRDTHTIKDIRQEIFLKVYNNIHKYDPVGSFEGWLRRLSKNFVIDVIRKDKVNLYVEYDTEYEKDYTEYQSLSDYDYERDEKVEEIISLSKDLSNSYGLVFNMYFLDGMSHKEISEKLNISEGTSKSNLHKAKKKIKQKIKI
jgi:RNA polymerase sigma-70 factor (ECF subfamily)